MSFHYALQPKTKGANPFKIFEELKSLDQDRLNYSIREMPYSVFMATAYWFAVSQVAKSRAGMRCQVCNSGKGIQAHHRTYDTHGREHNNMMDLVVLCENCHGLFHGNVTVEYRTPPKPEPPPRLVHHEESHWEPRRETKAFRPPKEKRGRVIPHDESEIQMPDGDLIVLTKELINQCRGVVGGEFTNATLRVFGLTKPLISGWPQRLVGTTLTREAYRQAVEGRYRYNTGPLPKGAG